MGYLNLTIKGISWVGLLRFITRVIAFGKIALLARLLSPNDFGIFAIASLVLVFLEIFTETGINVFLIQEEGKIDKYLNTAWIVSIVRGVSISLLILIFSPWITLFFDSPNALGLLTLISLVPFIRGFINPAIVRFQKELQFNKEFVFKLAVFAFESVVTVLVAYLTKSAVGLVWGLIAGALLEVALSLWLVYPRPKFTLENSAVKKIIARGKWVTGYGIFIYLFENMDDIVVGKLLNTYSLGLYQVAYKISSLPITEVSDVTGRVVFPVLVKISGDVERLKSAFKKSVVSVSLSVIPIGLILFLFPYQIVSIMLGDKWIEAAPLLRVLSVLGVVRAITSISNSIFLALKKQEYVTKITFVSFAGLALTVVPAVINYKIIGAVYSAIFGILVSLPLVFYYLKKTFSELEK